MEESDVSVASDPSSSTEPRYSDPLQNLVNRYCQPGSSMPVSKSDDSDDVRLERNNLEYLDVLGSIPVDDASAPFVTVDDSASDDGSDEFSSDMPLSRSQCFTAEEVVAMACDRMRRLRRLYIEELKQVAVEMRQAKKRYVSEVARERRRRIGDPLLDYVAISKPHQKQQNQLKAMRRHRRPYPSQDTVLRWSLRHDSQKAEIINCQLLSKLNANCISSSPQVQFSRNCCHQNCRDVSLPLTKYCTQRNSANVLFRK